MDWNSLARRAVRQGMRYGLDFLQRSMNDSEPQKKSDRGRGSDTPVETRESTKSARTRGGDRDGFESARQGTRGGPKQGVPKRPSGGYPGDFEGKVRPVYSPDLDGDADPGEVVWAWIPFEEDFSKGKDRPALIIGHDSQWLLALMLTSKDHVPGSVGDIREDEHAMWMNVGSGDWDAQGRASEVRLDRVIRVAQGAVRREGAIVPMALFSQIVDNVRN